MTEKEQETIKAITYLLDDKAMLKDFLFWMFECHHDECMHAYNRASGDADLSDVNYHTVRNYIQKSETFTMSDRIDLIRRVKISGVETGLVQAKRLVDKWKDC